MASITIHVEAILSKEIPDQESMASLEMTGKIEASHFNPAKPGNGWSHDDSKITLISISHDFPEIRR